MVGYDARRSFSQRKREGETRRASVRGFWGAQMDETVSCAPITKTPEAKLDRKGVKRAFTALAQLKNFNHLDKCGSVYRFAATQRCNATQMAVID